MTGTKADTVKIVWSLLIFVAIGSVEAVMVIKLIGQDTIQSGLLVSIVAMSILLFLSPRVFEIMQVGFGRSGIYAKLEELRNNTEDKIKRLFAITMSPPMYENLKKIASSRFGPYEMSAGLKRELYHLRDIGYAEVESVSRIPSSGDNLSEYVKITQAGRDFVKLRKSIEEDQA